MRDSNIKQGNESRDGFAESENHVVSAASRIAEILESVHT